MKKKDTEAIKRDFAARRLMQTVFIGAAFVLMVLIAVVYKRPDIFGQYSKSSLFAMQIILVVAFINLTALNWRCPWCRKYLGNNLDARICKHCGTKLK